MKKIYFFLFLFCASHNHLLSSEKKDRRLDRQIKKNNDSWIRMSNELEENIRKAKIEIYEQKIASYEQKIASLQSEMLLEFRNRKITAETHK